MKDCITISLSGSETKQELVEQLVAAAYLFSKKSVELDIICGFDSPEFLRIIELKH